MDSSFLNKTTISSYFFWTWTFYFLNFWISLALRKTMPDLGVASKTRGVPKCHDFATVILITLIWMSHWRHPTVDGAKFWICWKWPAFLSSFSRLQVIQKSAPSTIVSRQCDIRIVDLIKELSSLWLRYLNSKYQVHRT